MRFTFVLVTKYYLDHNLKEVYTEGATSIENIRNSYKSLMKEHEEKKPVIGSARRQKNYKTTICK